MQHSAIRQKNWALSLGSYSCVDSQIYAVLHKDRRRTQIFVDDPLLVGRGAVQQLTSLYNIALMGWSAVGLRFAWPKGTLGTEGEWIGAKIAVDNERLTVTVSVTASKLEERRAFASLKTKPLI